MMIVPLGSAGLSKRLGNRPSYARSRQLQWQLPRAGRDQRGHQPLDVRDLVGAQSARVGMRPRHSWRRTCQSRHTGFGRKNTKGNKHHPPRSPPIHSLAAHFARADRGYCAGVRRTVRRRQEQDERYVLKMLSIHARPCCPRMHTRTRTRRTRPRTPARLTCGDVPVRFASRCLVAGTAEEPAVSVATTDAPRDSERGGTVVMPNATGNGGDAPSSLGCVCW